MTHQPQRIAIIGAGLAGLTLASSLHPGHQVTVFEKARGVGGRMSTRSQPPFAFDHGAQFFTARSPEFQAFLKPQLEQGTVTPWEGSVVTLEKGQKPYKRLWFEPHYVATPTMNSLCKVLKGDLTVHLNTQLAPLTPKTADGWALFDIHQAPLGVFDWVISTAPAPQTRALFPATFAESAALEAITMAPNFTIMLAFESPLPFAWHAAKVKNSPIGWIAQNAKKPGRAAEHPTLVVQSTPEWAAEHLDAPLAEVQAILLEELKALLELELDRVVSVSPHRWRYAEVQTPAGKDFLVDVPLQLAVCGDGCLGGRVEAAFLSALRLGERLKSLWA